MDPELQDVILRRFTNFLNLNYPCSCSDADCPQNYYEAEEMVRMIEEELKNQNKSVHASKG